MAKSILLREREVRAVLELVGQCREIGEDPLAWRQHLVDRLPSLLECRVALSGEVPLPGSRHATMYTGGPQAESAWGDADHRARCHRYWQSPALKDDPYATRFLADGNPFKTAVRQRFVADREWFSQWHVNDVFRAADVGSVLLSWRPASSAEMTDRILLLRDWSDREFDEHAERMFALLHDQLAPQFGRALAGHSQPSPSQLPPRQRQVLELLLAGMSDREIGGELGLRRATVSEYCGAVYRHFGCNGRAELLAQFLQKYRSAPPVLDAEEQN